MVSLRYAEEGLSARTRFMQLCGKLQGRKVLALKSNPETCARVLASSNNKGQGIEMMLACPAWEPIFSIESVDGADWEWLSREFQALYAQLDWQAKISPLTRKHVARYAEALRAEPKSIFDAEKVSRLTAQILFELCFDRPMSETENELFYQASLEWRKEIAIKGKASANVKAQFWAKLKELVKESKFCAEYEARNGHEQDLFLSLFAQPLIISPQINFSDIMPPVFHYLRSDSQLLERALQAAREFDLELMQNICMEAIRLKHPFPVLERELTRKLKIEGVEHEAGTQVYIMLDEFEQEQDFQPDRWQKSAKNPYRTMPFGTGQRMCLGKQLATEMLGEFLGGLLREIPFAQIQPEKNHLYSGRDNDQSDPLSSTLYQVKIFAKALKTSFGIGKAKKKVSQGKCPFSS